MASLLRKFSRMPLRWSLVAIVLWVAIVSGCGSQKLSDSAQSGGASNIDPRVVDKAIDGMDDTYMREVSRLTRMYVRCQDEFFDALNSHRLQAAIAVLPKASSILAKQRKTIGQIFDFDDKRSLTRMNSLNAKQIIVFRGLVSAARSSDAQRYNRFVDEAHAIDKEIDVVLDEFGAD